MPENAFNSTFILDWHFGNTFLLIFEGIATSPFKIPVLLECDAILILDLRL